MNGIEHIRSAAVDYKHRRVERRSRKEVDDALAASARAATAQRLTLASKPCQHVALDDAYFGTSTKLNLRHAARDVTGVMGRQVGRS